VAEKVARKVALLIELEQMADVDIPGKILSGFECLTMLSTAEIPCVEGKTTGSGVSETLIQAKVECPIDEVLHAFLIRSSVSNAEHGTADKISRLRQFFGTRRINALDPRPPEKLKHARKGKEVAPYFIGNDLKEITTLEILTFFAKSSYGRSSEF